jgi:hypothetical protein
MNKKINDDDYLVLFKGAKLQKREANKVGLGIIFGIAGMLLTNLIPIAKGNFFNYAVIFIFAAIGYFVIGNKIFKKK